MNKNLIVNTIAAVLIVLVFCWVFSTHSTRKVPGVDVPIMIIVKDGIYQPSLIQVPAGKPVLLQFLREDNGACSATVVFPQLNLSYSLPLDQKFTITLQPHEKGEIDFTCQMGMYRGKIIFS